MTDDDIELESEWDGDPGALVAALLEVGFLVGAAGKRSIHDWQEHNPYAATKGQRIEKGRKAAAARWSKDSQSMPGAYREHTDGVGEQCPPAPTKPSEPNGSGAAAPAEPDPLWHTGLAFLQRKGVPIAQARAFIGKLKREAGDIDAAALLAQAESDDITEPIAWLSKAAVNARNRRDGARASPSPMQRSLASLGFDPSPPQVQHDHHRKDA